MDEIRDQLEEQIKKLDAKIAAMDPGTPEYKSAMAAYAELNDTYLKYVDRDREFAIQSDKDANYEREFAMKQEIARDEKWRNWVKVGGELLIGGLTLLGYCFFTNRGFEFEQTGVYTSDEQKSNRHFWKPKLK